MLVVFILGVVLSSIVIMLGAFWWMVETDRNIPAEQENIVLLLIFVAIAIIIAFEPLINKTLFC